MAIERADAQGMGRSMSAAEDMQRNVAGLIAGELLSALHIECEGVAGMEETPERMVRALLELTEGMRQDPAEILSRTFDDACNELIVVRDIPFVSVCEHHIMPFTGTATIGYLPALGRVVGLSKIPRLVHCFARRPQLQERLTRQIAEAMMEHVKPEFVGVVIRGQHSCMRLRGVQSDGEMVTSCVLPSTHRQSALKEEFHRFAT